MFLTTYTVSLYRNEELQSDGQMCEAIGSYTLLKVKHTKINTLDTNYYYSTWTQKSRWLNTSKVYFLLTFHVYCGSVGLGLVFTVGIQASADFPTCNMWPPRVLQHREKEGKETHWPLRLLDYKRHMSLLLMSIMYCYPTYVGDLGKQGSTWNI